MPVNDKVNTVFYFREIPPPHVDPCSGAVGQKFVLTDDSATAHRENYQGIEQYNDLPGLQTWTQ